MFLRTRLSPALQRRLVALALSAAALGGCLSYEPIRRMAARDFGCSTSKIEVVDQEGSYQVTGCGQFAIYNCIVDTQGYQHCTPEGKTELETVQLMAPGEMNCPRTQLTIEPTDVMGLYKAKGCNKEETFFCTRNETTAARLRCAKR